MSIDKKVNDEEIKNAVDLFEHLYNPVHFFCRLKDMGIDKQAASRYTYLHKHLYDRIIQDVKQKYS